MQRFGRVLRLKKGKEAAYERYHAAVWPEVLSALRKCGIRNYSIYRYGPWLFSYFELPDDISLKAAGKILAKSPVCAKWEKIMHTLQEPLPESGKDDWWVMMQEVFRL
jgi:L-rhamnose mutarotase